MKTAASHILKTYRIKNEITQKELANALGTSGQFVSQLENGRRPVPRSKITQISNVLDIEDYKLEIALGFLPPATATFAAADITKTESLARLLRDWFFMNCENT